jgi:dolichol kinase
MSQVEEDLRTDAFEVHELNLQNEIVSMDELKDSTKSLFGVALGSLASVALAVKAGLLPLPADFVYTDGLIARDMGSSLLGGALAYIYVKFVTSLATEGTLEPRDSRKLIHTLSAPLYLIILPIFTPAGRCFAACVPLINGIRLYLAATGDLSETDLANAVSRTGDKQEALGGPLVYVIVVFAAITLFWRENLIGVTALCTMAAGDGMADIVGRRFGAGNKWFFSENKSMAGSLAFWLSASLCTTGAAAWLSFTGCLELPFAMGELTLRITAIAAACAMVELLPFGDDNWNVPISAAILAAIFLQ